MRPGPGRTATPAWAGRAVGVLTWAVLIVVLGAGLALVALPRLTGWVPLTVTSGSMTPTYPVGSQVVVEPLDHPGGIENVDMGDVVTFMPRPDDGSLVTHRVVGIGVTTGGERILTTRGDANTATDEGGVTQRELRGTVRYGVPLVGYVATMLDAHEKWIVTRVVGSLLLGYAAYILGGGLIRSLPGPAQAVCTRRGGAAGRPATTDPPAPTDTRDPAGPSTGTSNRTLARPVTFG